MFILRSSLAFLSQLLAFSFFHLPFQPLLLEYESQRYSLRISRRAVVWITTPGTQSPKGLGLSSGWCPDNLLFTPSSKACLPNYPLGSIASHLSLLVSIILLPLCFTILWSSNPCSTPFIGTFTHVFAMGPDPKRNKDAGEARLRALQMVNITPEFYASWLAWTPQRLTSLFFIGGSGHRSSGIHLDRR